MKIEQFNSSQNSVSSIGISGAKVSTQTSVRDSRIDQVKISTESAELTKAVESVRRNLEYSRSIGYIDPPRCLSNGKQLEIIGSRITKLLQTENKDLVNEAAKSLWRESGYKADDAPLPNLFSDGYFSTDLLTLEDRLEIDKSYDEDIANGLSENKAMRNALERSSPLTLQRYKEYTINLGAIWDSGNITAYTDEEWEEFIKNKPPEYKDVHGMSGVENTHNMKTENLQLSPKNYVFQKLLDDMEDFSSMQEEYKLQFQDITYTIFQRISEMTNTSRE